jgi:hypothetical protein
MVVNWLYVALVAGLAYAGPIGVFLARRQWTWAALGVAMANLCYVLPNLVAPFRGALDPAYAGYSFGVFRIPPGPLVTLVAGGITAAALASACLALRNRPGRGMAFIAIVGTVLLLTVGLPELLGGLMAPADYGIELGEYLRIPGLVSVAIVGALFCLPMIASIVWSARRLRPAA